MQAQGERLEFEMISLSPSALASAYYRHYNQGSSDMGRSPSFFALRSNLRLIQVKDQSSLRCTAKEKDVSWLP